MMGLLKTLIIFALYLVQGCYSDQYKTVIAVTSSADLERDCLNGSHYHYTIDELPSLNVSNGTLFVFCLPLLSLKRSISYANVSDIGFVGFKFTKLVCNVSDVGIELKRLTNVKIQHISIEGCGILLDPRHDFKAGLTIYNSNNMRLTNVTVTRNSGTGLALFYNSGLIEIINVTFKGNGVDGKTGGNGVYVETGPSTCIVSDSPANYSFVNCSFLYNKVVTGKDSTISGFSRFDKGGGMCMYVRGSENVEILIIDSKFKGNRVEHFGGGLYISYFGNSTNNNAQIINVQLESNVAQYGGGVYAGYLHSPDHIHIPQNCGYTFSFVTFTNNIADYGGGFSLISTKSPNSDSNNFVRLENCEWTDNKGQYGAAVAILPNAWNIYTPGYLPRPVFVNSTFTHNTIASKLFSVYADQYYKEYSKGLGIFYCSKHKIYFREFSHFRNNSGSAIVLDSCVGIFTKYSFTHFENNNGFQGGAICILSSVMYVNEGTTLQFHENKADDKGGAIYERTTSALLHHYSITCFIDYTGPNYKRVEDRNVTLSFVNNFASQYGHSIFVSSLNPCYHRFSSFGLNISNVSDIFETIGNFTYFPANKTFEIATDANHSEMINNSNWSVNPLFIPGKEKAFPVINVDDFGQEVQTNYLITFQNHGNSNITAKQNYSSIPSNITLSGSEGDKATVTFSDMSPRQTAISFNVSMEPCPPGFILERASLDCICSFATDESYYGIDNCNLTLFQAYSKEGFWFGYKEHETESEGSLISGHCPHGFCLSDQKNLLPATANREALNDIMCSDSRSGILCGRCVDGSAVYYHSLKFKCGPDNLCYFGWLFYILSEIIPVTILFLVIIIFNIPFTSGLINGFIFYCQAIEVVLLLTSDLIHSSEIFRAIDSIYSFIYSMFSLNFFVHDSLSYCIWKTNRAINIIALKFLTSLYSFLLVILVTVCLRKCSMNYCRFARFERHLQFNSSIIHGLSAFLILFYAQCARTFVLLLSSVAVNNKGSTITWKLVYYDGEMEWFGREHLAYAIPAIILGIVVLIIPPIILLIYPLHNKVLSFLGISEVKCVQSFFRPLDRLKPFFDSFQSCFKDKFRFFSGLYLLYRFSVMFNVVYNYIYDTIFFLEFQLLIMLAFHAICQPYKQRLHNAIDTLLFVNLAIIVAIKDYNLTYSISPFATTVSQTGLLVLESILMILPMIVAAFSLIYVVLQKFSSKRCKKNNEGVEVAGFDADRFPERDLYESLK